MSTTYCRLVNGNTIYAAITDADAAGNNIVNTYATKSEVAAVEAVPSVGSSDDGKVLQASYDSGTGTGSYEWTTPPTVDEVPAVTSSDDGKLLAATYSGGTGSYGWSTVSIPTIGTVTI
jgi:hypothetical protein